MSMNSNLIQSNQEQSIVVKELIENEYCEIQYKEDKLFLNNKEITDMKNELFKILKQSILSLQKSVCQQEIKFAELFKIFNSYSSSISESESEHDNNLHNKNQNNKVLLKDLEHNFIQNSQQNKQIEQYFSIILMDSQISDNKKKQQQIQNKEQIEQQQNQQKLEQNLNNYENLDTDKSSELIKFLSPLNKTNLMNFVEIFDLKHILTERFTEITYKCDNCDDDDVEIYKINSLLKQVKAVFIFEEFSVYIEVKQVCSHLKDYHSKGEYSYPDFYFSFGEISNLKYHKLSLYLEEEETDLDYSDGNEINIIQDGYLKYLEFHIKFLPFIKMKQEENQFLSCLSISQFDFDGGEELNEIQQFLNNIRFSELHISDKYLYCIDQIAESDFLDNPFLFLVLTNKNTTGLVYEEEISLINEIYANKICFFTLNKLFNTEFSVFRLAFDLYDQS